MRGFSLLPDKRDWMTTESMLDSQDLHDMYVTPDYAFTPWLYHFTVGQSQCYIKECRNKFKLIINNFRPTRIPFFPCSGYNCFKADTFKEIYHYFKVLCLEMLDYYKDENYGLPF